MSHDHKHHHDHAHTHEHPKVPCKGHYPRTLGGAWQKAVDDTKSIFEKGINRNPGTVAHGDHMHPADPHVSDISKVVMLAGAAVSLGVTLHGVRNVVRGVNGWEDKDLGETHAASAQYTVVGAAETLGGLALMKRLLTGTFKIF